MRFERLYTTEGTDPFDTLRWQELTDGDGRRFRLPVLWGQGALEVLAAAVFAPRPPQEALRPVHAGGVPDWLRPQAAPEASPADGLPENDLRDVLHRVAGGLCHAAFRAGLFDDEGDARIFYDELCHMMLHRIVLPETALLGSVGLDWAYGPAFARAYVPAERIAPLPADFATPAVPYAAVAVSPDLPLARIARRIALLAGITALEAQHAGPLTAIVPAEHAEALAVLSAPDESEIDTLARALGRRLMDEAAAAVMEACDRETLRGFDPAFNGALSRAVRDMRAAGAPETLLRRAIDYAQQGYECLTLAPPPDADLLGAAAGADILMPGDNASPPPVQAVLSVGDDFIETALTGHGFLLRAAGQDLCHADAEALWARIGERLWTSGQPQFLFRDSAASAAGANAATLAVAQALVSPAGVEAPGAVLNLSALASDAAGALVDHAGIVHAVRVMTAALDAALDAPGLSPRTRARRPLVIGYSGLSGLLMSAGVAYDSAAARVLGAQVTALVSGAAHLASAELADRLGAYDEYAGEARERLAAMRAKMAAQAGARGTAKGVMRRPPVLNDALSPDKTLAAALADVWGRAYAIGKEQGLRHAHLTGLATSLDMQALLGVTCRDIAPEAACVRFEGFFGDAPEEGLLYGKKLNPAVPRALRRLGYAARQIDDIHAYAVGHGTLLDAPAVHHAALRAKGVSAEMIVAAERLLPAAQDLRYVFNRRTLGPGVEELPVGDAEDILAALGFNDDDIDAASLHACGAMTLEGAPHLLPEHLDVFDCLLPSGHGIRRVPAEAQIAMQAAVEPFLCGAVAQTLILDHHAGIEDMQKLVLSAWERGVKRIALWREGASLLQPAALLPRKWETSLFAEEEEEKGLRLPPGKRRSSRR